MSGTRGVLAALAALPTAGGALAQPSPPAGAVRAKQAEVFARPEFRPSEPGAGGWLLRQLLSFFQWLGTLYDGNPLLFWVLLVGCSLLLVALLVLIAFQVRRAFGGWGDRGAARERRAQRVRLSADYRARADERASAGDYTEAVRFLFLSLVYRLDERGRVNFQTDYTNREYLELVGDRLSAREGLGLLVDTLDDHWYAERPCGREQYAACRAVYDRLAG